MNFIVNHFTVFLAGLFFGLILTILFPMVRLVAWGLGVIPLMPMFSTPIGSAGLVLLLFLMWVALFSKVGLQYKIAAGGGSLVLIGVVSYLCSQAVTKNLIPVVREVLVKLYQHQPELFSAVKSIVKGDPAGLVESLKSLDQEPKK